MKLDMRFNIVVTVLMRVMVSSAKTATYSLGDLSQYTASVQLSTPTLSGAVIAYSGYAGSASGVDVYVSSDLQKNITIALERDCQSITGQCIQSIKDILNSPETELEARQDPATITIVSLLVGFVGLLFPFWYHQKQPVPVPIHVPAAQISQASSAISASATVVVTGSESPTITITSKPDATSINVASPPVVTTFTYPSDGHQKGDVVIKLTEDLARRMDGLIRRYKECDAGTDFNKGLQRRNDDLGAVICAAQGVIINAEPGRAFADYLIVRPQPLPWTAGDVVRAMEAVMQFAQAYAAVLGLDSASAAAFGVGAFAVAWQVLINNQPLGKENVIPAASLAGTTKRACSTMTAEECYVSCTMVGPVMKNCHTTCQSQTSCGATDVYTTTATLPWVYAPATTVPINLPAVPTQSQPPPVPNCQANDISGFPSNVFQGVYGEYCARFGKDFGPGVDGPYSKPYMFVDSHGKEISDCQYDRRIHCKRSPPPDPDAYSDYYIRFDWKAKGKDVATPCSRTCAEAYKLMATGPCGHTGGEQNLMTGLGNVDIGCGTFSYEIDPPPPPVATLGPQQCYKRNQFNKHGDISKSYQHNLAETLCQDNWASQMMPQYEKKQLRMQYQGGTPYNLVISWIKGCTSRSTMQDIMYPMGWGNRNNVNCTTLLKENYLNCNNGGDGGWRTVGCVKYDFRVQWELPKDYGKPGV